MGLLDQFSEFARTPEGQGLLSAAFGGLAGARRGQPLNSIGRAGLAGMQGYGGALDRQQQDADNAFNQQFKTAQLDELKRKQAKDQAQQAWLGGLPDVMKQAETTYGAGDEGPTKTPGNTQALEKYLMDANSPFASDLLKQELFPEYKVAGGDVVKLGRNGVSVVHQSQRPDSLPSDQKNYNLAVSQGYTGSLMDFMRDRVSNTEGAKAELDLVTVTLPGGQTTMLPRSVVANMAGGGGTTKPAPSTTPPRPSGNFTGPGYAGGSANAAVGDQRSILQAELAKAMQAGNPQDIAALQREISRLPGGSPAVPGFQVQGEAEKQGAVERAKAEAKAGAPEAVAAKDAQRASIQAQISVIDKALKHPGRETATGLSSALDPRNFLPGTNARDFQVVLDQLGGAAFLQAFESLKGGGQITEVEGNKATAAIARLNRAQSDAEFETALKDLREVMDKGLQRLGGTGASGGWDAPKPASPAAKAPPKPMKGMVMDGYKFKGGNPADRNNWERM